MKGLGSDELAKFLLTGLIIKTKIITCNWNRKNLNYSKSRSSGEMKTKIEAEKIVNAVKKIDGIEIVVENTEDAKEAINLILRKTGLFEKNDLGKLKDFKVTAFQKYETSAVNYKIIFLLEFLFEEDTSLDTKVSMIKGIQEFFEKV